MPMEEISTLQLIDAVGNTVNYHRRYVKRKMRQPKSSTIVRLKMLARAAFVTPEGMPLTILN